MAKKLTVFQRLGQLFTPQKKMASTFVIDGDNLSDAELYRKSLELKQFKYIEDAYRKVDLNLYQQYMMHESSRLLSYADYDAMEQTPEISAALDLISEEACTPNEDGDILTIRSDSNRIKEVLHTLFYDVLSIEVTLHSWARNMIKYGDSFLNIRLDPDKGIVNAIQLPVSEIVRDEVDIQKALRGDDSSFYETVKFKWRDGSHEFNSWEMAHFRLLSDDSHLPYGVSMLDKVRRIWKQLLLAEDAMLVYRVVRAPERRVFYVDVGNINDADIDQFVDKVANRFKRNMRTGPDGRIDLTYNPLTTIEDYFIPVRGERKHTAIDTLPGAANLDQIGDITYLQNKLFSGLRVPKAFLNFEEAAGDGKNLSMQDIRFARTINKVQQALLQELNKIAVVHLYTLGFEDDLDNFNLSLTTPSTQAEMMKVEIWTQKLQTYSSAVADPGVGISPMSSTKAKKLFLGMSDDDIILDLEQQRMEKVVGAELAATSNVITKSGIFEKIDRLFGTKQQPAAAPPAEGGDMGGGAPPPPGGGMDMGGGMDLGGGMDMGGDLGGEIGGDLGGEIGGGEELAPAEELGGGEELAPPEI